MLADHEWILLVSELTSEQLSRGQQKEQMKMSHLREQEIARSTIEKNQLETRTVREQLRALAGQFSCSSQ